MRKARRFPFLLAALGTAVFIGTFVLSRPATHGKDVNSIVLEAGSGQLEDGQATIRLRDQFALGTKGCEHTAHITPRDGKAKGYLYVKEMSSSHMIVAESGDGESDARFDYLVVAVQWSR